MGPPRMALAAAAAAAAAGGGGGAGPAGLTLAAELVPGVECARCPLASALGSLQPLLRRLAALLAAPQPLPDLDLDLELGRLRRLAAVVAEALAAEAMGGGGGAAASRRDEVGAGVMEAEAAALELRPVRAAALRRNWVTRPPPVLVLQLQRTVWDHVSGTTGKDGRHVAFPAVLPASELAAALGSPAPEAAGREGDAVPAAVTGLGRQSGTSSASSPPPPYVLVAVAVHYGGADSGHYLVYRRVPAAAAAAVPSAPVAAASASHSGSSDTTLDSSPSRYSGTCGGTSVAILVRKCGGAF
ncbi:hypothetical protein HYH03_014328 [Edaphochlamys debaryana]|uniref:ubiquitinyl hydrolase 1 n=1 Tax=Edaphochlamys debaryana TaxID=47281 RepID=A0A835XN19_9CHLO|nr:hypothetical protein HYH03_014328 [Edaphochlamys debaryana]|eukprot:KAG2487083.1 hypothetical protein HYH03_014328 [Edaphochlamys debaryana]